jgi:hypothetical protein
MGTGHEPEENEEGDESDVDSAGVYYMSVEDFEWRPSPSDGSDEADAEAPKSEERPG